MITRIGKIRNENSGQTRRTYLGITTYANVS